MKNLKFLLLTAGIFFLTAATVKGAANSSVYFTPSVINTTPNQIFTLDSTINPGVNQVTAVEMHLSYDPNLLQLNSITPSTIFSQVLKTALIDNVKGNASITVGIPLNASAVMTISPIATVSFTSLNTSGSTSVSYSTGTIASAFNETGNVINSIKPASITISILKSSPTPITTVIPLPSTPSEYCQSYNSSLKVIPIKFSWDKGRGLQVWDDTGFWWFNNSTISPILISSKDNLGISPGFPVERTIYARTTYDWKNFSRINKITCRIKK